jgi:serine kinase of HPr protein (carbohydrate metabolism regulator)
VTQALQANIHATCVELAGAGVLLRGPSGSGKSDLALRLIDGGARLVADDRTIVLRQGSALFATAPEEIAGRLEVRGLGIVSVAFASLARVLLLCELVRAAEVDRLPHPATTTLLGVALPCLRLDPFPASAAAKLRLAVHALARGQLSG